MNATFKIEIPNLAKLQDAFRKAPQIASVEFAKGINSILSNIHKLAVDSDGGIFQFKTPRSSRTGHLNKSFSYGIRKASSNNLSGSIGPTAFYAKLVEFGTRPHTITAKNGALAIPLHGGVYMGTSGGERMAKVRVGRNARTAKAGTDVLFRKSVHHPGTQGNPFMERLRDASAGDANNQMSIALENIIKQIAI